MCETLPLLLWFVNRAHCALDAELSLEREKDLRAPAVIVAHSGVRKERK